MILFYFSSFLSLALFVPGPHSLAVSMRFLCSSLFSYLLYFLLSLFILICIIFYILYLYIIFFSLSFSFVYNNHTAYIKPLRLSRAILTLSLTIVFLLSFTSSLSISRFSRWSSLSFSFSLSQRISSRHTNRTQSIHPLPYQTPLPHPLLARTSTLDPGPPNPRHCHPYYVYSLSHSLYYFLSDVVNF